MAWVLLRTVVLALEPARLLGSAYLSFEVNVFDEGLVTLAVVEDFSGEEALPLSTPETALDVVL